MSTPLILAVGASGPFAGLVVPELAKRGARVRGLIRDAKQSDAVLKNGAAEIAIGDLTNRASMDAALQGVDAVFYIAPAFMPDEANVGQSVVEAAKAAGVRRLVFSSVIDPVVELQNHSAKVPVERAIIESGMEYVLLQPALFFQNFEQGWPQVLVSGTYGEPWSDQTLFSRVDYRDVAEVAALALLEDNLLFGTYQLCAEGMLSRRDVAKLMGEVLGRDIEPVTAHPPASTSTTSPSPSPMQKMFDWYGRHPLVGNALPLRAALNREPRTLRAYFEELAAKPQ